LVEHATTDTVVDLMTNGDSADSITVEVRSSTPALRRRPSPAGKLPIEVLEAACSWWRRTAATEFDFIFRPSAIQLVCGRGSAEAPRGCVRDHKGTDSRWFGHRM
jgi:hypothetical protein